MNHIIPPMTDPLGAHWRQPRREDILVDDTHALMAQEVFDQLPAYDRSYPSGVYPGKMWSATMSNGTCYLRWFGEVPGKPNLCSNNHRLVLIV